MNGSCRPGGAHRQGNGHTLHRHVAVNTHRIQRQKPLHILSAMIPEPRVHQSIQGQAQLSQAPSAHPRRLLTCAIGVADPRRGALARDTGRSGAGTRCSGFAARVARYQRPGLFMPARNRRRLKHLAPARHHLSYCARGPTVVGTTPDVRQGQYQAHAPAPVSWVPP